MFDRPAGIDAVGVSLISPTSNKNVVPDRVGQMTALVRLTAGSATGFGAGVCGRDAVLAGKPADVCAAERRQSLDFGWTDVGAQGGNDRIDQCLSGFLVSGLGVPVPPGRGS